MNEQFLRTDLATYLRVSEQSGEEGLTLEYVEALPKPEPLPSQVGACILLDQI